MSIEPQQRNSPATRTDEEREFDAISEKDIWTEARDRLQISTQAESTNRSDAKIALEFREGDQWDKKSTTVSEDEPELTINLTDALCMRVENNIRQQRPRGKCHPVGDGADVETAEVINGIMRHVETRSEASVAYDGAASSALTCGWGYFRMIAEYVHPKSFEKDLRILPIRNRFTVNMDPGAIMPAGQDQGWCLISVMMKRNEYRRRFPRAPNVNWEDIGNADTRIEWEDKEDVRVAEYFRVREIPSRLYLIRGPGAQEFVRYQSELPRDPATNQLLPMDQVELLLRERGLRIDGERESTKRSVEWFRLNGVKVIQREQLPGQYIPVFRVEDRATDIDGKVVRRGMVKPMMDPARMVNFAEVAKIKRLGIAPKAPWVGAVGQFANRPEWDDANKRPYSKLEYVPATVETGQGAVLLPPPMRQPPAQVEAGFAEVVASMKSNLMAVSGMPNEPGQDQQGVVVSGQAIKRRQFLSDQSHFHVYDNLTLAIAQCWRVGLEWIPFYYTEARMQRCIGEDSTPRMVAINKPEVDPDSGVARVKNDLSVGRYDVVMDTGPGYETKREEGAQNLIDLVKIPALAEIVAKQAPDLVFRSIDHPYMQELADRLSAQTPEGLEKILEGLSSRARSLVQSMSKQIQALQQQNQQLQEDLKGGITKAHLSAVVKAHDTEVRAETARHDTETKAGTAIAIEELRAGAKLIADRAEHGREAELLERQLSHAAGEAERQRQFLASESQQDREAQPTAPNGAAQ